MIEAEALQPPEMYGLSVKPQQLHVQPYRLVVRHFPARP